LPFAFSEGILAFSSSLKERDEVGGIYWEWNEEIKWTHPRSSIALRRLTLNLYPADVFITEREYIETKEEHM